MKQEVRGPGFGAMAPAPEPSRGAPGRGSQALFAFPGEGTGLAHELTMAPTVGLWLTRWNHWRGTVEQLVAPAWRRYWRLYRAFDDMPISGPNADWRDKTVIAEYFKIVENHLPKIIMAQFGSREWFAVESRESRDERYESIVKLTLDRLIDGIGRNNKEGGFLKRVTDAFRYRDIMGHVFFKVWWREEYHWVKTKQRDHETGTWTPIERNVELYNGVDLTWLDLGVIAKDLTGGHRWYIERQRTTIEALQREDEAYFREHGEHLYKNLDIAVIDGPGVGAQRESYEEPRSTERWPLDTEQVWGDPAERPVELWLCWDNVQRTLTKILNRLLVIGHGYAPTPDGLDPYIEVPGIPIPGRPYGESLAHYVGPLSQFQTKIARARADEVLLGVWQQYMFREGAVASNAGLFEPGGALQVENVAIDKPLTDLVQLLPRRPMFTEAYTEEQYRQTQAEAVAGVDAISMGNEATQKSRDVSATETQQRILQGAGRHQLENLYLEEIFKRPLLDKIYYLAQLHLTQPITIEYQGEKVSVDLSTIQDPVDIIAGGGVRELTRVEKQRDIQESLALAGSPVFGPLLKPENLLIDFFTLRGNKNPSRYVKSPREVAASMPQPGAAPNGAPSPVPAQAPPTGSPMSPLGGEHLGNLGGLGAGGSSALAAPGSPEAGLDGEEL